MKIYSILCLLVVTNCSLLACKKQSASAGPIIPQDTAHRITSVDDCKKCLVVCEQYKNRIGIFDVNSQQFIWEWTPQTSDVASGHYGWFGLLDEAKPVYDGKYILLTGTNGGVALVRIRDKKTIWYGFSEGKPHSAELLPDGNIVCSNATGLTLTLFTVDTLVRGETVRKKTYYLGEGHNVVWDLKRKLLWTAAHDAVKSFRYNNNCQDPDLTEVDNIKLPGSLPHDLFPVYGEDALWLSTSHNVYKLDIASKQYTQLNTPLQNKVKSISSGPEGYPIIIIQGKEDYWTDEIKDLNGARIYQENNLKIYKARWLVPNAFSYPATDTLRQCK